MKAMMAASVSASIEKRRRPEWSGSPEILLPKQEKGVPHFFGIRPDEFRVVPAGLEEREPGKKDRQQDQNISKSIDSVDDFRNVATLALDRIGIRDLLGIERLPHVDVGPPEPALIGFERRRQVVEAFSRFGVDFAD